MKQKYPLCIRLSGWTWISKLIPIHRNSNPQSFIKEIEEKFEEIEEANVTGNLDGGEGPIKTPNAFSKSKDEDDLDDDHIEVLGYKKSKEKKPMTAALSLFF